MLFGMTVSVGPLEPPVKKTPETLAIKGETFPKPVKNGQPLNGEEIVGTRSGSLNPKNFRQVHVYANEPAAEFKSYSQVGQDLVILKLMKAHEDKGGKNGKFFVDLAANDAIELSNSLHLEQNGWHGLCIEGNPNYWFGLAAHRNCTVIGAFVGGESDGVEVDVKINNGVNGGIAGFDNAGGDGTKRHLISMATLFEEMSVPEVIDYMSLDVEGAEYFVMEHFPFEKYMFRFITIERPPAELEELLGKHGYKRHEKDFIFWGETLWFHPNASLLTTEEFASLPGLKQERRTKWRPRGGKIVSRIP